MLLDRNVHYGNIGKNYSDQKPQDEAYLFKPENTKEIWQRIRDVTDRYGYECRFDELGDVLLGGRNNPHRAHIAAITDVASGGNVAQLLPKSSPSAYGGTYIQSNGTNGQFRFTVAGARIDVILPRSTTTGTVAFSVYRQTGMVNVANGTVNTTLAAGTSDQQYYDFRYSQDGTNATVATIYTGDYDTYVIDVSPSSGNYRINALLLYHTDPIRPLLPQTLATDRNALSVRPQSEMDAMRNHVIVVGKRQATVTDSNKLETNPLNADQEFIVASAVDVGSIADPNASNFIGYPKESLIFDDRIGSSDHAAYVAQAFIFRQRNPKPGAAIDHTWLPIVQLGDPVWAEEKRHGTIAVDATTPTKSTLYIQRVVHRITYEKAITQVFASGYPEFPSYEPREDIDIDAYFNSAPVVNVSIAYTSLTNTAIVNVGERRSDGVTPLVRQSRTAIYDATNVPDGDVVQLAAQPLSNTSGVSGFPPWIELGAAVAPWPPVRDSLFLKPGNVSTAGLASSATYGTAPTGTNLDATGAYRMDLYSRVTVAIAAVQSLTSVVVTSYVYSTPGTWYPNGTYTAVAKTYNGANRYEFEYDAATGTLTIFRNLDANTPGGLSPDWITLTVNYAATQNESGRQWFTNTPYHHFLNVDYRDQTQQNYLTQSEDLSNAVWTKDTGVTVTANTVACPFGPVVADTVVFGSGAGSDALGVFQALGTVTGARTGSIWLRADAAVSLRLGQRGFATASESVIAVTTEWQRFTVSQTLTAESGYLTLRKTSGDTTARTVYAWGAQVNDGASAVAYVPTQSTAVSASSTTKRVYLPWNHGDKSTLYTRNANISSSTSCKRTTRRSCLARWPRLPR